MGAGGSGEPWALDPAGGGSRIPRVPATPSPCSKLHAGVFIPGRPVMCPLWLSGSFCSHGFGDLPTEPWDPSPAAFSGVRAAASGQRLSTLGSGSGFSFSTGGSPHCLPRVPGRLPHWPRLRTVGVTRCLHLLIRPFWRLLAFPGPEADAWAQDGVPRLRRGFRTLTNSLDIHTHLLSFWCICRKRETLPRELRPQPWGSENMTGAPVSCRHRWSLGPWPLSRGDAHLTDGREARAAGSGQGRRVSACVRPVPPGECWPRGLRRPGVCFTQVLAPSRPDCVALCRSLDPLGSRGSTSAFDKWRGEAPR